MKTLELHVPDSYPQQSLDKLSFELNEIMQTTSRFVLVACPPQLTEAQWEALRLDLGSLVQKTVS
jgi:hypothetical protein